ncbi:MAG: peptidoglycan DD-metalloendopeptidase family protein [Deferribacteres bacterium]|nr:peptidoglycan DD-metalloendopeptidase family protein [Deferribacteres bacterium]
MCRLVQGIRPAVDYQSRSGYHSLYGNLSEIFHRTGDIIRKGEAVGTVGKSRLLNVPSLYFEIRYKGKPVNPLAWLKKERKRGKY